MGAERDPVAVVVGATGGIGSAVATDLAARGFRVWLASRDEHALVELTGKLPGAAAWPLDLAAGPLVPPSGLVGVDVLVHCAGVFDAGPVAETSADRWRHVFAVNLFGVVEVTRALLPALRRARGRAILVNSTVVRGAAAGRSAYAASKEALRVFAEALHQEELENGVRVTTVYPGRVATGMQREVRQREGGPYEPEQYLAPEAVAAAVASVVSSPDEAHVTELTVQPARGRFPR
ncbi:NADP-dependent 3-hydroxy acid dehydrogenase YdfG [Amycolatopsis sacchari]|uniref:NADP-dependent 3-hydroxy acid dehydrogenase YdfG n=1 Tax=Amycolatopsis sacchari TaxID=115433 RepID=A0A1I3PVF1_9PSEU|nr:NADP-dependent 3-hydroxy acid dehydrogenase YdfG [Amycolatopsis sacchari]